MAWMSSKRLGLGSFLSAASLGGHRLFNQFVHEAFFVAETIKVVIVIFLTFILDEIALIFADPFAQEEQILIVNAEEIVCFEVFVRLAFLVEGFLVSGYISLALGAFEELLALLQQLLNSFKAALLNLQ